jgi:hypothetical protein
MSAASSPGAAAERKFYKKEMLISRKIWNFSILCNIYIEVQGYSVYPCNFEMVAEF